jgi:predicted nucleotidyltransferase
MRPRQALIEAAVPLAVERLRAEFAPLAIYQFGSSALGAAAQGSDLDLLVIVEDSGENFIGRIQRASRLMHGLPVPIDIVVYTRKEFEERSKLAVSLERSVKDMGRLLYAA